MDALTYRPVLLLAKQRSGTQLLRSLLCSCEAFYDCGEVFYVDPSGGPADTLHYQRFLQRDGARRRERQLCSREEARARLVAYLRHLSPLVPRGCHALLDVKYNSSHHLNLVFHDPLEAPTLLEIAAALDIPVIHLVRRNVASQFISNEVANAHNVFAVGREETFRPRKIRIDPAALLHAVSEWPREVAWFVDHLGKVENVCHVAYEQLAACESGLPPSVRSAIGELLGVELPARLTSSLQKMVPRPKEVIENLEEVVAVLRASGHAHLLDDLPSGGP